MTKTIFYLSLLMMISCISEQPIKKENIKSYTGKYAGLIDLYRSENSLLQDSTTGKLYYADSLYLDKKVKEAIMIEVESDSLSKMPYIDVSQVLSQLQFGGFEEWSQPINIFLDGEGVVKLDTIIPPDEGSPIKYTLRIDVDSSNMWLKSTCGHLFWSVTDTSMTDSGRFFYHYYTEKASLTKNPNLLDLIDLN